MLSPSVTGHGLHRLGLKSIEVKLKSNEAKPSWTSTWPKWTWVGVARGDPSQTPIKSIEAKLKSNEAKPSWTSTWPRWTWSEVAQGGGQVHRGQVHQSQVQVQRGAAELDLDLAEMDLAEMYLSSSECNFSAMLTRREASTPRRSRGVLVLPTSQLCIQVGEVHVQLLMDFMLVHWRFCFCKKVRIEWAEWLSDPILNNNAVRVSENIILPGGPLKKLSISIIMVSSVHCTSAVQEFL